MIESLYEFGISAEEAAEAFKELVQAIEKYREIAPALDEKTENPNQNSDLEIFDEIVWNEKFLKKLDNNNHN